MRKAPLGGRRNGMRMGKAMIQRKRQRGRKRKEATRRNPSVQTMVVTVIDGGVVFCWELSARPCPYMAMYGEDSVSLYWYIRVQTAVSGYLYSY